MNNILRTREEKACTERAKAVKFCASTRVQKTAAIVEESDEEIENDNFKKKTPHLNSLTPEDSASQLKAASLLSEKSALTGVTAITAKKPRTKKSFVWEFFAEFTDESGAGM